jgi:hypothetical protein
VAEARAVLGELKALTARDRAMADRQEKLLSRLEHRAEARE